MEKEAKTESSRSSGTVLLGGLLIVLGVVFLLGEMLDIRIGQFVWPFFVIAPGVLLFLLSLTVDDSAGQGMAAAGGIVTMVGLLLFYQNVFDHWESWAYAWALVAPTAVGLGMFAYGLLKGNPEARQSGADLAKVGLGIFFVAAFFFELVIGISGFGLGRLGWPLLLIALGLILMIRNIGSAWRKK